MRAALHGSTNPTNWKKPKQRQRNSSITIQESKHPQPTKRGRKGQTFAPFLFMSEAVRKGKKANNPTKQRNQPTKPRKQARQEAKQESRRKQDKRTKEENKRQKDKRTKSRANSPQAFNPPNHSRVQKPYKPRKAPKQYKHTRNKRNPAKTPLKCEIRHICKQRTEDKAGKQTIGREKGTEHTKREPEALHPAPPAPSGHHHRPTKRG